MLPPIPVSWDQSCELPFAVVVRVGGVRHVAVTQGSHVAVTQGSHHDHKLICAFQHYTQITRYFQIHNSILAFYINS